LLFSCRSESSNKSLIHFYKRTATDISELTVPQLEMGNA